MEEENERFRMVHETWSDSDGLIPVPTAHHLQSGSIVVTSIHHHVAHLHAHVLAFVVSLPPVDDATTAAADAAASRVARNCCLRVAGVLTASSATVASAPAGITVSATTTRASPSSSASPPPSSSWFLVGHLRVKWGSGHSTTVV